jgi:hypothetical protein
MTIFRKIASPALILLFIASLIFAQNAKAQSKKTEQRRKKYYEKYKLPQNNVKLKLVNSFPGEELLDKDIYIRKAVSISHDGSNIYACDMAEHEIFVFDINGNFLKKFGTRGQGPGNLLRPTTIIYWRDLLIVYDIGNLRIQFLDKNGQYKKSFRTFYVYHSLALNQNGQIYGAHFVKYNEPYIVDALALNGKKLFSFCESIKANEAIDQLNFVFLSANDKGSYTFYVARLLPESGIDIYKY